MTDRKIRVLLIDDEEDLIEYLSKRLLKEGFTVRAVTSGREALEVVAKEDFDVAVVDLKMPGMDGIETQERLKELKPFLQTIVLTGHGSFQAALDSGKQHAFRFLNKPVDHDELVETLREAAKERDKESLARFRDEMAEITAAGGTPRDIVQRVEALRKKYGIS